MKVQKEISTIKFIKNNKSIVVLTLIFLIVFIFEKHDKFNREKINIQVEKNEQNKIVEHKNFKEVNIFIYNVEKKELEEKQVKIMKKSLLDGDYVSAIIENTPFIKEEMHFLSAYTLVIDEKKTLIIKLNSNFLDLKEKNDKLYKGFVQSVQRTMLEIKPFVQVVKIQIDGEKGI